MPRSLVNDAMLATMRELAGTTPAGAFIEVGVYQGGSAAVLYEVAREQGRPLYLFDTFEGIPMQGPLDRHKVGDFADTSADDVRALFPRAVVREGIFPYRLGETGPVAFVHADADQYQSTVDICHALAPRMVPGGLMLFDDYCLDGCRAALRECLPEHEELPDGRALARF